MRRSARLSIAIGLLASVTWGGAALGASFASKLGLGTLSANAANVLAAKLSVDKPKYTGACPVTLHVTAHIYSPRAASIRFQFSHSPGASGPTQHLTFADKGTQNVFDDWQFTQSLVGTVGFGMSPVPDSGTPPIAPTSPVAVQVHCT